MPADTGIPAIVTWDPGAREEPSMMAPPFGATSIWCPVIIGGEDA